MFADKNSSSVPQTPKPSYEPGREAELLEEVERRLARIWLHLPPSVRRDRETRLAKHRVSELRDLLYRAMQPALARIAHELPNDFLERKWRPSFLRACRDIRCDLDARSGEKLLDESNCLPYEREAAAAMRLFPWYRGSYLGTSPSSPPDPRVALVTLKCVDMACSSLGELAELGDAIASREPASVRKRESARIKDLLFEAEAATAAALRWATQLLVAAGTWGDVRDAAEATGRLSSAMEIRQQGRGQNNAGGRLTREEKTAKTVREGLLAVQKDHLFTALNPARGRQP
jgi:hypothetical protein